MTTRLHHGCRLISDWLYIPIRFQNSEEDHTHNAQQEREEGKLSSDGCYSDRQTDTVERSVNGGQEDSRKPVELWERC